MALEVLAGGDFSKGTAAATAELAAFSTPWEKLPIKQYVFKSILKKDFVDPVARTSRLHLPGQVTRRAVVNAVISYLGNKNKADSLMHYYTDTVAIVAGVSLLTVFVPAPFLANNRIACSNQASWTKLIQYEHEAFWALLQNGETSFDPAWLADYCGVSGKFDCPLKEAFIISQCTVSLNLDPSHSSRCSTG